MPNDENAKNPKAPIGQSAVAPQDYPSRTDNANGSANTNSSEPEQNRVEGFAPNLSGHAKAGHSQTSSFGNDVPKSSPAKEHPEPGQEEGGRMKQPTTSAAGHKPDTK